MQYIIIPDLLFQTGSFGYTNINVHFYWVGIGKKKLRNRRDFNPPVPHLIKRTLNMIK